MGNTSSGRGSDGENLNEARHAAAEERPDFRTEHLFVCSIRSVQDEPLHTELVDRATVRYVQVYSIMGSRDSDHNQDTASTFTARSRDIENHDETRSIFSARTRDSEIEQATSVNEDARLSPFTFVLIDTDIEMFASIEKRQDGFYLVESRDSAPLLDRYTDISSDCILIVEDQSKQIQFSQLMEILSEEIQTALRNEDEHSFQFAIRVFNKLSQHKHMMEDGRYLTRSPWFRLRHDTEIDTTDIGVEEQGEDSVYHCQFSKRIFDLAAFNKHEHFVKIDNDYNSVAERILGADFRATINDAIINHVSVYKISYTSRVPRGNSEETDLHGFVIFRTNSGILFSLDERPDGIYLGKSPWFDFINQRGSPDSSLYLDIELVISDESNFSVSDLVNYLTSIESSPISNQGFLFASGIFDKIALNQFSFNISCVDNLAESFLGAAGNDDLINHVAIYRTPLEVMYSQSPYKIRQLFAKQWTPVDYHAFLVLRTTSGDDICIEKSQDGIYLSKSPDRKFLINGLPSSPRNSPVELIIENTSEYSLKQLLQNLEQEKNQYELTINNCQHFAKRHFDKLALSKHWEFERPKEFAFSFLCCVLSLIGCAVVLYFVPYSHIYSQISTMVQNYCNYNSDPRATISFIVRRCFILVLYLLAFFSAVFRIY